MNIVIMELWKRTKKNTKKNKNYVTIFFVTFFFSSMKFFYQKKRFTKIEIFRKLKKKLGSPKGVIIAMKTNYTILIR